MKRLLPILLLVFSVAVGADVSGIPRIVDGDGLKIGNVEIRLHGIDAPERKQTCKKNGKVWPCGAETPEYMRGLVSGREIVWIGKVDSRT